MVYEEDSRNPEEPQQTGVEEVQVQEEPQEWPVDEAQEVVLEESEEEPTEREEG